MDILRAALIAFVAAFSLIILTNTAYRSYFSDNSVIPHTPLCARCVAHIEAYERKLHDRH